MFGYLLPYKPELKMREFECYRAVYCGLCKQLAKDYGFSSRMLLNYDMVLLSLMADGLANQPGSATLQRCMVNPKRRPMLNQTSGLQLAADCIPQSGSPTARSKYSFGRCHPSTKLLGKRKNNQL